MKGAVDLIDRPELQRAMDGMTSERVPGLSVHISTDHGVLAISSGVLTKGREASMSNDSCFPISCMMKAIISYLTLDAYCRGVLDIDEAVSRYLPELHGGSGSEITIRHILSHTAGYRDPAESSCRWRMSWEQLADHFREREQMFEPGQIWSYTHSGHPILARIIERVEGRDALQLASERVFAPLGIEITKDPAHYASPHKYSSKSHLLESFRLPPERGMLRYSLADLHLTPSDMSTLARFLYTPPASREASAALAMLQEQAVPVCAMSYGERAELIPQSYGLGVGKVRGMFSQNGSFIGATSAVRYDPKYRVCVVVSVNCYDPYVRDKLGSMLMSKVTGSTPPSPPPCLLPFGLAELRGSYKGLMMGMGTAVVEGGGQCRVSGPAGEVRYVLAESSQGILSYMAAPTAPPIGFAVDPDTGGPMMQVSASAFKRVIH